MITGKGNVLEVHTVRRLPGDTPSRAPWVAVPHRRGKQAGTSPSISPFGCREDWLPAQGFPPSRPGVFSAFRAPRKMLPLHIYGLNTPTHHCPTFEALAGRAHTSRWTEIRLAPHVTPRGNRLSLSSRWEDSSCECRKGVQLEPGAEVSPFRDVRWFFRGMPKMLWIRVAALELSYPTGTALKEKSPPSRLRPGIFLRQVAY